MKATQRQIIDLAKKAGLTVLDLSQTGGDHFKLSVQNSIGSKAFFVFANTCSDNKHASKNNQSLLRRFAAGIYNPVKPRGSKK